MARFRNDFGEDRIVPTLGYVLVAAGDTVTVPDDEWHHWDAGGWTPLDPNPATTTPPVTGLAPAPSAVPTARDTTPPAPAATAASEEVS